MSGIIGKKVGMTRVFTESGEAVPVTVLEAGPCPVVQVKTEERDGYRAIQLGFGAVKEKRATRAELGHARQAGLDVAPRVLKEFDLDEDEEYEPGHQITVEVFEPGEKVRVSGTSKGRGFTGVVKRHGFSGRPSTHGHPMSRTPGSIGPGTDPSRVIKGRKMPGQHGSQKITVRNIEVVKVDPERNLLFLKGGVPGARNSYVLIQK